MDKFDGYPSNRKAQPAPPSELEHLQRVVFGTPEGARLLTMWQKHHCINAWSASNDPADLGRMDGVRQFVADLTHLTREHNG